MLLVDDLQFVIVLFGESQQCFGVVEVVVEKYCLDSYWGGDVGMWVVVFEVEIFEVEGENVVYFWVDLQCW